MGCVGGSDHYTATGSLSCDSTLHSRLALDRSSASNSSRPHGGDDCGRMFRIGERDWDRLLGGEDRDLTPRSGKYWYRSSDECVDAGTMPGPTISPAFVSSIRGLAP